MLTDQRRYIRYMQITSDTICFAVLYLIFVPAAITICRDCGLLFSDTGGILNNICIYKSPLYLTETLIGTLLAAMVSGLAAFLFSFSTNIVRTILLAPLGLSALNWYLLKNVLFQFSILTAHINPILWISSALFLVSLVLNRMNILLLMKKSDSHNFLIKHVVLTGINEASIKLATYIVSHPNSGLRLAGFLSTTVPKGHEVVPGFKVLGQISDLPSVTHTHVVDMVVVLNQGALDGQMEILCKLCITMGVELLCTGPVSYISRQTRPLEETLNGTRLIRYKYGNITPLGAFLKRAFDFTVSGLIILACLPFWGVVSLMIKSSSKGPIFFRQERIGKCGRKFILYKFRSMQEKAEQMQEELQHLNEMDGPAFKIKDDPRQTPTGRVLRKHSLDELPQLFNVFKGDISLVGPRPAIESEVRQYRLTERRRLSVIQGITCVWQISGRNEIQFDEWMKLDLMYIDNRSVASDLKILYKTIPAVLMKRGAY